MPRSSSTTRPLGITLKVPVGTILYDQDTGEVVHDFANADDALAYGNQLCDKVSQGRTYADLIGDVKSDFQTADEFQASYLIDKAVNELCPAQIWQLRRTAAHYQPQGP